MEGVEGNPKRLRLQGPAHYAFHCQTGPSEISFSDFKCMHGISAGKAANTLTVLPSRGVRFIMDLRVLEVVSSNQLFCCSVAEVLGCSSSRVTSEAELKPTRQSRKTIPL